MQIINTFDSITNCYPNGTFDITAWRRYTRIFSLELSEKCEQDSQGYDFENEVLPVLNNVMENSDKMILASNSFIAVTSNLKNNIDILFHEEIELDIILYLGLCNGAGWATTLDNRNVILLGMEKIIELDWQNKSEMQALIFHEIGHIWHNTYGNLYPHTSSKGEKSLVQLYQEGIAMVCEQILCQDVNYYHQNINGWLDWCFKNKNQIKQEYLKRINNCESTQDFFGDWCSYQGYSDVGYFLGCEFIKYLQENYSLVEIANFNIDTLFQHFNLFAK